jgi:hypothetical protein
MIFVDLLSSGIARENVMFGSHTEGGFMLFISKRANAGPSSRNDTQSSGDQNRIIEGCDGPRTLGLKALAI